jgi:RimJ/RimL family protein N-acetyltransferase
MFTSELIAKDYSGGTLRFIKPSLDHARLSLKWLKDPEVGQYMGADFSGVSMQTEEDRIKQLLSGDDTIDWMIELDGAVIGNIEINSIKEMSVQYGVKAGKFSTLIGDKTQWGKGIAPAAKRAVMDWAFSDGGFELFVGKVLPANTRSVRSIEHLGFEFEKTEYEEEDGKTIEWRIYTMSKQHWLALTQP